jgi:hypothetical protein
VNLKPSAKLSFEEKKQAVRNFIVASYHNQIHIKTYHRLAKFLTDGRIKLLRPLKMSGKENIYNEYRTRVIRIDQWYTDDDAEKYFEWLVAVINETEDVEEGVVKQAYNQLFRFLYVMRDDMERTKNVPLITPYDWQELFTSFDERLTDIQRIIDRGNKDTVEVLKSLLELMKKNKALLETLYRDSEELFGKVKPDE